MARRLALGLILVLAAAAPAGADNASRRQQVQQRLAVLNAQVARSQRKADVLRTQIAGVSAQIRTVARQVDGVSLRLAPIERELVLRETKLNRLNALFQLETDRLHFLQRQYGIALSRLNKRLVGIYETEPADTLTVVLAAASFADFLDAYDYAKQIGKQDRSITDAVAAARAGVRIQLVRTKDARAHALSQARVIAYRVHQVRVVRDRLAASRDKLAGLRSSRQQNLDTLEESEKKEEVEIRALRQEDLRLAGVILTAQSGGPPLDTTLSASGLIWPVSGPVTSGFGPRWGSFHYGLDIAASTGTPIHAAAAGTVIYAGWYGGFGNFVILDHGGGIVTTYGHQSQIAVSVGQRVGQGDVIGYIGSTGFSTGPHLDLEVRVNGQPVDPLGYL